MDLAPQTVTFRYATCDAGGVVQAVLGCTVFLYPRDSPTIGAEAEAYLIDRAPADLTLYDVTDDTSVRAGQTAGADWHPRHRPVRP